MSCMYHNSQINNKLRETTCFEKICSLCQKWPSWLTKTDFIIRNLCYIPVILSFERKTASSSLIVEDTSLFTIIYIYIYSFFTIFVIVLTFLYKSWALFKNILIPNFTVAAVSIYPAWNSKLDEFCRGVHLYHRVLLTSSAIFSIEQVSSK